MPHAIHEHIRPVALQRPLPPPVDVPVHPLELVGQGLRRHARPPQQPADVIDPPGGDTRQIHLDQRLLDTLLTPAVALDDGGLEKRALELGHPPPAHQLVRPLTAHAVPVGGMRHGFALADRLDDRLVAQILAVLPE